MPVLLCARQGGGAGNDGERRQTEPIDPAVSRHGGARPVVAGQGGVFEWFGTSWNDSRAPKDLLLMAGRAARPLHQGINPGVDTPLLSSREGCVQESPNHDPQAVNHRRAGRLAVNKRNTCQPMDLRAARGDMRKVFHGPSV